MHHCEMTGQLRKLKNIYKMKTKQKTEEEKKRQ